MTHSDSPARVPDSGATYVFAVCRDTRAVNSADLTGLSGMPGGGRVRLIASGALTAVAQTVPAADFTDEVWQPRLSDRREIERYARAHHEVVSAAAAAGPVVPLPLATLYLDDERVRRVLADEAARFHGALQRVAHHAEWGVKVYRSVAPPERPAPVPERPVAASAPRRGAPAPGAGLAYLNRKRGVHDRRERRREEALGVAESVDAELRELAAASRRLRTHGAALTGEQRVHVLNATYLVAADRADELRRAVGALRERTDAQIELSGPWVPYSFVGEV
ncbi:GvpL/GvpF family gas vesicle protein [Streptomyces kunmingensis]|uniref:GvpL/GvpF family gas vesicle protein n=1 Tax=Streptomyces kunmingensis TaxID=68225 RepID=A0ABU6CA38_9ACTN|nr:GvpL/GvpF family gas vesicle protein [Streptomyces kunmingensis]MEB3961574.1 GvpL/GvpF family gas vesicle protein [Streptomyces kunmingensis]